MSLLSQLFGPRPAFRYLSDGGELKLTAQQYGAHCIDWGTSLASVQVGGALAVMSRYRDQEDLIVKIQQSPAPAHFHARALFVAAYLTYPVLELRVPQHTFKNIMQGATEIFNDGRILQNVEDQRPTADYIAAMREEISEYSSLIFGGIHQSDGDALRAALSHANAGLLEKLEDVYSKIAFKPREAIEKGDGSLGTLLHGFKNPAFERTREVDAKTLITNTLTGYIFQHLEKWRKNKILTTFG